jgi:DNA-binding GntR family transcriptional regulator
MLACHSTNACVTNWLSRSPIIAGVRAKRFPPKRHFQRNTVVYRHSAQSSRHLVSEGILERQQGRGTFIRRPQFQSSLFRFFRFQSVSGERQVPESRILSIEPVSAPSAVSHALGLPLDAPVIRMIRLRLLDAQPVLAEEIWLPQVQFQTLLEIDLSKQGPLLYPIYEELCGQVVAYAEETLTAEAISEVHARLLQVPGQQPGGGDRASGPQLRRSATGMAPLSRACQPLPLQRRHPLTQRRILPLRVGPR